MNKKILYTKKIMIALCALFVFGNTSFSQTILTGNIGEYKLTKPGTYQISGKVVGNINIKLTTPGAVIIEGIGTNPFYEGIPRPGEIRAVGHIGGEIDAPSTLTIRNVTLAHNVHHIVDFGGSGYKYIKNVTFIGQERVINGKTVFGVAPGNMGGNGLMEDCVMNSGDDAHQVTSAGSTYKNNKIIMYGNGSVFQFGWNNRFEGRVHYADSIEVTGVIKPNITGRTNTDSNSGRCVIGGQFNNPGGDIKLTNLNLQIPQYNHLIKMVVTSPIDDILIQGTTTSVYNAGGTGNLKAIVIAAKAGGSVRGMVVDLGAEAANPKNHFIQGNVDVKFVYCGGTKVVEYKAGQLIRNDGACTLAAKVGPTQNQNQTLDMAVVQTYPNPFENELTLVTQVQVKKVSLINHLGQTAVVPFVTSANGECRIQASHLTTGMYVLKIESSNGIHIVKALKR